MKAVELKGRNARSSSPVNRLERAAHGKSKADGTYLPSEDDELDQAAFAQAVTLYDLCLQFAEASASEAEAAPARSERRVRRFSIGVRGQSPNG